MFDNYGYFKAIAQGLSLSSAASELYVTQPALSKYLNRLERSLGVTLVDRSTKPIRVTEAGKVYLSYIEEHERLLRSLSIEMSRFSQRRHHVVIGITTWRGAMILPEVYERFQTANPSYELEFKEAVGDVLLKLLEDRSMDFCLMNVSDQADTTNFEWVLLEQEEIRLVMRKDHPLFDRHKEYLDKEVAVDLSQIQQGNFIMLLPSQQLTRSVDKLLREQNVHPRQVLRLSSMSTALNIVARSDFYTFYPHSLRTGASLNENLTTRRIKSSSSHIPFGLVMRRGHIMPAAVIPVMEFILRMYGLGPAAFDKLRQGS